MMNETTQIIQIVLMIITIITMIMIIASLSMTFIREFADMMISHKKLKMYTEAINRWKQKEYLENCYRKDVD